MGRNMLVQRLIILDILLLASLTVCCHPFMHRVGKQRRRIVSCQRKQHSSGDSTETKSPTFNIHHVIEILLR